MNYTRFMMTKLPLVCMPWSHLRWALFANAGAKTRTHVDAYATAFTIVSGEKFIAIGPADEDLSDLSTSDKWEYLRPRPGEFRSRHAFTNYEGHLSNAAFLRFEFLVLPPDATL